ncbi:MAG TPA: hypothetical protein VNX86_02950 [Rhizomicrobium sp.]|jgi:hypothetical protein|nr:hypothetical protein [Rhizomicrobium sp.]
MTFAHLVDWLGGAIVVVGVLWTLVKSVHVRVNIRVRKLDTPPPADDGKPRFTFEAHTRVEHGKPITFGARSG